MKNILSRDINGACEGECRDLVRDNEIKQQKKLDRVEYSGHSTQSLPWASGRSEQPGFLGGHV